MSDRIEDSPELFGFGVGMGTLGNTECEFCGVKYEGREDEDGEPLYESCSIRMTDFAGKRICECCFGKIEFEILARMPSILTWYIKIIKNKDNQIQEAKQLIDNIIKEVNNL